MGAHVGQAILPFVKGGMTGLSQGLQQQQNPNKPFDFSNFQSQLQAYRKAKVPVGPNVQDNGGAIAQGPQTNLYG